MSKARQKQSSWHSDDLERAESNLAELRAVVAHVERHVARLRAEHGVGVQHGLSLVVDNTRLSIRRRRSHDDGPRAA